MYDLLFSLHLLFAIFAIFAIGSLAHDATTAGRGVRTGDAQAAASAARMLKVYSIALILALIVPTLSKANALIESQQSVGSLTVRVAAAGGIVGVIFAAIVFLMVYRPGD